MPVGRFDFQMAVVYLRRWCLLAHMEHVGQEVSQWEG